ncbi:MAG: AAA family ATPase [Magnetococcales bacterium]|nr:AAA family ATPase [Magnetococcales bacterium]
MNITDPKNRLEKLQFLSCIYESNQSKIHRCLRLADNSHIILKVLNGEYPSPENLAQFQLEYETTRLFDKQPGIVQSYGLQRHGNSLALLVEDFAGESLDIHLRQHGPLKINHFLDLAIRITQALGQIQAQNVIHKDINPSNIVWNRTTDQIKIIDFGIASQLGQETPFPKSLNLLEGTLAYISPEQTGRMNRLVDYRTDFYSLGATFYELLTGSKPFPHNTPLQIVHSHVARQAKPPHKLRSDIPEPLSQIVLKLLNKDPEKRYQSTNGLLADLTNSLKQWNISQTIPPFAIGQQDELSRFRIPQKLYGRDSEIKQLLTSYERAAKGSSELVLVAGHAGSGKTALVGELRQQVLTLGGLFAVGKYNLLSRDEPYLALIQGLKQLLDGLWGESESSLLEWKERILKAVANNGRIMVEILPELERLIGAQPEIPELDSEEAGNRFRVVLHDFLSVFSQKDQPLVLFLDDLQWADLPSIHLIEKHCTLNTTPYMLIIGSFRNEEVDDSHALMASLDNIGKKGVNPEIITLPPLGLEHTAQMVADTTRQSLEQVDDLANLCQNKTAGNPFFLLQFLKILHAKNLLKFKNNCWQWDVAGIKGQDITDNLAQLMANRIDQLGIETQRTVQLAACIGTTFDLGLIHRVHETSSQNIARELWPALQEGLIIPLDRDYQLAHYQDDHYSTSYRFVHDWVQRAAYDSMDQQTQHKHHLAIGRLLLADIDNQPQGEQLFAASNHFNHVSHLIHDSKERLKIANLYLLAGHQAKASAAFDPAYTLFRAGLNLLPENSWQDNYKLTLDLHLEATEGAFLSTRLDEMEQLAATTFKNISDKFDLIKIYKIQMAAYTGSGQHQKCLDIGLTALVLTGVTITNEIQAGDYREQPEKISQLISGRTTQSILNLPMTYDPNIMEAVDLFIRCGISAYMVNPFILLEVTAKGVEFSFEHGLTEQFPALFSMLGIIMEFKFHDYEAANFIGKTSLQLIKKHEHKKSIARTYQYVGAHLTDGKEHVEKALEIMSTAFEIALENGQFDVLSPTGNGFIIISSFSGRPLIETKKQSQRFLTILEQLGLRNTTEAGLAGYQMMLNLIGEKRPYHHLSGWSLDGKDDMDLCIKQHNYGSIFIVSLARLVLLYLFGKYRQALTESIRAEELGVGAPTVTSVLLLYGSLTRLALYPSANKEEQITFTEKIDSNQTRLKTLADFAPMNFSSKFHLVEAEKNRILKNSNIARDHYDIAIQLANKNRYMGDEALAMELAGCFYLEQKLYHVARHYLKDARHVYGRWGAAAKVDDLESRFSAYLTNENGPTVATSSLSQSQSGHELSTALLDLPSVIQASQILFSEINTDSLIKKLMTLAIENAGAQRGVLTLKEKEQLLLMADADLSSVRLLPSLPLDSTQGDHPYVPTEIIRHVERNKQSLVWDAAKDNEIFAKTKYIVSKQPQSALAVPLVSKENVIGIIYLENSLSTGVFTQKQVEMTRLIGTQAALSINNSRYITAHKKAEEEAVKSKQRVRELSAHMEQTRESEKKRIAAEVHDELGSQLTKLKMDISWLQKHPPKHNKDLNKQLKEMSDALSMVSGTVKRISRSLRPKVLDEFGLTPALDWLMVEMSHHSRIKARWAKSPPEIELNDLYKTALFRICQEALTNVAKHANANEVEVLLSSDETCVALEVLDDGDGVDLQELNSKNSFGVGNMRERVMQLDGQFGLERQKKGGTRLWVRIPPPNMEV